jgi:DNA-binding transcriptional MerR regulator
MQMQLPIFPSTTKLINNTLGVRKQDDMVYYLHNGSPILCHQQQDLNNYRYIMANLVENRLCTIKELSEALGVNRRNVERYVKSLREKGPDWFFNRKEQRGSCHKLTDDKLAEAERLINEFYSVIDVARMLGVTEGALRYHMKKGTIKKKW